MITNKDVTIIIPVYNCEKYIQQCLASAIGNGCPVIVVNDGSTDNTKTVIDNFKAYIQEQDVIDNEDLTVVHFSDNKGTARVLNEGIKLAKTDWIKWLSADDILVQDAITDMLEKINQYCHQNNRIFYTHYDVIDKDNKLIKTFIEPEIRSNGVFNEQQIITLLDHFYGNGSTSLMHKDVFSKVGLFDESLGYQEDYDFWLRAVCLYDVRLTLLQINTIYYRVHNKQLTNIHKGESLKKSEYIRNRIYDQRPELELLPKHRISLQTRIKRIAQKVIYH